MKETFDLIKTLEAEKHTNFINLMCAQDSLVTKIEGDHLDLRIQIGQGDAVIIEDRLGAGYPRIHVDTDKIHDLIETLTIAENRLKELKRTR